MMIRTTKEQKNDIIRKINSKSYWHDEKVWTYLYAYLIDKSTNKSKYIKNILGTENSNTDNIEDLWFESEPISPRKGKRNKSEGNSKIDLAIGGIGTGIS